MNYTQKVVKKTDFEIMVYVCNLGLGQQVYLENPGIETIIRLVSSSAGQQQQSSSSFATGKWLMPPSVFRTPTGAVLRFEGEQGSRFVMLQGSGMSV
ncbi:MAG: zinc ribbon domain-containing protein, partial [Microcoleaceae cyanobacterium]